MFIQKVCCKERAIELIDSIKSLWIEPYEDIFEEEYGVSFGSNNGYVIYNYTTSIRLEILEIVKENKELIK